MLALNFAEAVTQVICQPFRLRFTTADDAAEHIPDVLAVASGEVWLITVRPAARIDEADGVKFAASAEAALACGRPRGGPRHNNRPPDKPRAI